MMTIIYRISDAGYAKTKPDYITNENCLRNAVYVFDKAKWIIIADNCSEETLEMINRVSKPVNPKLIPVHVGHGAGTFNIALNEAIGLPENDIVYFIENDYVHKPISPMVLFEGIQKVRAAYITLYDHPDKYMNPNEGGNPYVADGGEVTRVMKTMYSWWKLTNSTTMTFAATRDTLREDEAILRKHTSGSYPKDFDMFIELRKKGKGLISPIPSVSTHGETKWLADGDMIGVPNAIYWRDIIEIK